MFNAGPLSFPDRIALLSSRLARGADPFRTLDPDTGLSHPIPNPFGEIPETLPEDPELYTQTFDLVFRSGRDDLFAQLIEACGPEQFFQQMAPASFPKPPGYALELSRRAGELAKSSRGLAAFFRIADILLTDELPGISTSTERIDVIYSNRLEILGSILEDASETGLTYLPRILPGEPSLDLPGRAFQLHYLLGLLGSRNIVSRPAAEALLNLIERQLLQPPKGAGGSTNILRSRLTSSAMLATPKAFALMACLCLRSDRREQRILLRKGLMEVPNRWVSPRGLGLFDPDMSAHERLALFDLEPDPLSILMRDRAASYFGHIGPFGHKSRGSGAD